MYIFVSNSVAMSVNLFVGLQEVKGIHCSPRWVHFLLLYSRDSKQM